MTRIESIRQQHTDATLNLALDTLAQGKQALVFCNTKRGSESQAEKIAKKHQPRNQERLNEISEKILLAVSSPTKQCKRLALCIRKGIAFHHSGLHYKQRQLIEEEFLANNIMIICSTPTLAMGMDLPAYRSIIRDLKRFSSGTSWGMTDIPVLEYEQMCITGDTLISTDKGAVPIKDIVESDKDYFVLSYNPGSKEHSFQPVAMKFARKTSSTYNITTKRGYNVSVTGNHPLFVMRDDVEQWVSASKVRKGDALMVSLLRQPVMDDAVFSLNINESSYLVDGGSLIREVKKEHHLSDRQIGEVIGVEKKNVYHLKYSKKSLPIMMGLKLHEVLAVPEDKPSYLNTIKSAYGSKIHLAQIFTEDFFWLAGIIASDGTLTTLKDRRTKSRYVKVRIGNTNPRIIEKAHNILKKTVDSTPFISKRDDGFMNLELGCTLLADILRDNFGIPHGAKSQNVQTPHLLREAPEEYIGAYLGGLFDGDGSYTPGKRVHFSTGSQKLANEIHQLLRRLGILSTLREEPVSSTVIRGKQALFCNKAYGVVITSKSGISRLGEVTKPVKCQIIERYRTYHNLHKYHQKKRNLVWLPIEKIVEIKDQEYVYNLSVANNNNYFANGILVHNCGRAGRPGKEGIGQGIAVASNAAERELVIEKYIHGDPEEIYSKLAVEPVLRTYVLSLIASGYVHDQETLYGFFDQTFYAFQYGDIERLHQILDKMTGLLQRWGFIEAPAASQDDFVIASEVVQGSLKATRLGERVAQLYLDPLTAHELLDALEKGMDIKINEFNLLHLLSSTLEIRPLPSVKKGEIEEVDVLLAEHEDALFIKAPGMYSQEYEDFLKTIKLTNVLLEWITERGEDHIMDTHGVRPGELHAKREIADWLLYSLVELSKLKAWHQLIAEFEKMRMRLQHGVKEEVLPLLRLKNIGRVRARILFKNNIRSIEAVKKAEFSSLRELLGPAIAADIKEQVGQKVDVQLKKGKRKGQLSLKKF